MSRHTLAVGGMYDPSRTTWPTTEQVRLGRTVCELVRFWPGATRDEVEAHDEGEAQFAVVDLSPHLLVLAYQFGGLDWSDAPFQAHRMTSAERVWPGGGPSDGLLLRTVLVDSRNGQVLSLRGDWWPTDFANVVRVGVAEQLAHEPDEGKASRALDALYDEFQTPEALVRARATSRCAPGSPAVGGPGFSIEHY